MDTNSIRVSISGPSAGRSVPLILGVVSAALAGVFVVAHWSLAVLGALVIFVLSALESQLLLLTIVFLLPVVWLLDTGTVVRDVMTTIRVLVAVGFLLGRIFRSGLALKQLMQPALSMWSLAFWGAALLSVTFGAGGVTHNSARSIAVLTSSLLFYFVVLAWVDSWQRLQKILVVLLCSTIATSLFAIVQMAGGGYTSLWLYLYPPGEEFAGWTWRATSFLNSANVLAGYLNLVLPLGLACLVLGQGRWRRLGAWTVSLGFVALVFTQSRGGLVAFGSVLILAIFCFIEKWRKRLVFLTALASIAFAFYFVSSALGSEHLGEFGENAVQRLLLWASAWDFFLQSPVFGIGMGNFTGLYGPYIHLAWVRPDYLTVNNLYLEVLSETGVIGFTIFFALVWLAIRDGYRCFRRSRILLGRVLGFGLLGAMVSTLVHGNLDLTLDVSPQFDSLFWIVLALFVVGARVGSRLTGRGSSCSLLFNQ